MFRKFKARGKLKVMTANPNPAQFLTHGLKAQHRGPERTAEHPHLLCPSARTPIRKNLGCMNNSKKNRHLGWKTRLSR